MSKNVFASFLKIDKFYFLNITEKRKVRFSRFPKRHLQGATSDMLSDTVVQETSCETVLSAPPAPQNENGPRPPATRFS